MISLLEQFKENNFLITCSNWFYAPDGKCYRVVWGKIKICKDEETLGIKTNSKSANWYAIVGQGEKTVIVAGCQILYACISQEKPFTGKITETHNNQKDGGYTFERECIIYLAQ